MPKRKDWLDRLTQATGFGSTITYAYDQVGNLVKTVAGSNTTNFTYGSYNRLSSWGGISYTYDANGNMITKSGGWAYTYDYENRLTRALYSGTTVQQNSYDGAGNLVKNVETDTRVFSYQGLNILYEKDTTTGTATKHFYAGGMQVAKMVGVTNYYMHPDALRSTRLVMTSTLTVQFSSDYKPYGLTYSMTGSESFRYTGKMSDSVTGLYYFGARWYDPSVGRFVTQDSYSGGQKDPLSTNGYIYAMDNPMKNVDPDGRRVVDMTSSDADPSYGVRTGPTCIVMCPQSGSATVITYIVVTTTTTTTTQAATTFSSDPMGPDRGGWDPYASGQSEPAWMAICPSLGCNNAAGTGSGNSANGGNPSWPGIKLNNPGIFEILAGVGELFVASVALYGGMAEGNFYEANSGLAEAWVADQHIINGIEECAQGGCLPVVVM